MYNHVAHAPEETGARLMERTLAFRRDARVEEPGSLKAFRERWEDRGEVKLLRDLPSCPFLGFVTVREEGDRPAKVGCLVHPLQNEGIDGRDCGVYDRFICEDYLCAAHEVLREVEMDLVIAAVKDSYLYGLVITNPRYVRSLLEIVAERTGSAPTSRILQRPEVIEAVGECFELLRQWPMRAPDGIFGAVEVAGALETRRRASPWALFGLEKEKVDQLVLALGTAVETKKEWRGARERVEERLKRLVEVVEEAMEARGREFSAKP